MAGCSVTVATDDGSGFNAYLAVPNADGGPGLVLFPEGSGADQDRQAIADLYAAEGYVVLCPSAEFDATNIADITATVAALRRRNECTGKVGALGFGHGGKLAYLAAARPGADCAVAYYGSGIDAALDLAPRINCPLVMHFAENDPHVPAEAVERIKAAFAASSNVATYLYLGVGRGFARPDSASFDKPAAGLAHSRSIALLRRTMGPHYDLEALWEKHTLYEFGTRDVAATMRTMVAEPYVNHIPVMTDVALGHAKHYNTPAPRQRNSSCL